MNVAEMSLEKQLEVKRQLDVAIADRKAEVAELEAKESRERQSQNLARAKAWIKEHPENTGTYKNVVEISFNTELDDDCISWNVNASSIEGDMDTDHLHDQLYDTVSDLDLYHVQIWPDGVENEEILAHFEEVCEELRGAGGPFTIQATITSTVKGDEITHEVSVEEDHPTILNSDFVCWIQSCLDNMWDLHEDITGEYPVDAHMWAEQIAEQFELEDQVYDDFISEHC